MDSRRGFYKKSWTVSVYKKSRRRFGVLNLNVSASQRARQEIQHVQSVLRWRSNSSKLTAWTAYLVHKPAYYGQDTQKASWTHFAYSIIRLTGLCSAFLGDAAPHRCSQRAGYTGSLLWVAGRRTWENTSGTARLYTIHGEFRTSHRLWYCHFCNNILF